MVTTIPLGLGLFIWMLSTLFVASVAYQLHRVLRSDRPSLNALLFVFLMIFVTTLFVLLAGLSGILAPVPMLAISVSGMLAMLAIPGTRRAFRAGSLDVRAFNDALKVWWADLPRWLQWFTVLATVVSVLRFGFLIWSLPPFVWDSLTYHLTNVAHWTQTGSIELFETSVARIYSPANYEALAAWFTIFIHHDAVIEAAGLPAYVLAILAVYAGTRGIGVTRAAAWMGALAYASMPALLLATTGTKNDPHMASYYLSSLAIVVHLACRRRSDSASNPTGQLIVLALILLVAAGTKAYIAHLIPGLLVVAWLVARQDMARSNWQQVLCGSVNKLRNQRTLVVLGAGVLILGFFLGSFWNVRNWTLTGNPFYPYGVEIGGQHVLDGPIRDTTLSSSRLLSNLKSLVDKFGDSRARIIPDMPNTTGWGWFVYTLGMVALIWGLIRSSLVRIVALGFAVSFILLMMSTRPSPWNLRYAIWFPALFSYAFAVFIDNQLPLSTFPGKAIGVLYAGTLMLNVAAVLNYGMISIDQFDRMLSLPLSERSSASLSIKMPSVFESAPEFVPEGAMLGYNLHSNGFIYPMYRADFSQRLAYVPIDPKGTCEEIAQAMETRGTRHLFVAPGHTRDRVIEHIRSCAGIGDVIRERARGLYVIKREP